MTTRFENFQAHYAANFSQKYFENAGDGEIRLWQQFANNLNIDLADLFEKVLHEHGKSKRNPSLPLFKRIAAQMEGEKLNRSFGTGECGLCDNGVISYVGHLVKDGSNFYIEPGYGTRVKNTLEGRPYSATCFCRCSDGERLQQRYGREDQRIQKKVIEMTIDFNQCHSPITKEIKWMELAYRMFDEQNPKKQTVKKSVEKKAEFLDGLEDLEGMGIA